MSRASVWLRGYWSRTRRTTGGHALSTLPHATPDGSSQEASSDRVLRLDPTALAGRRRRQPRVRAGGDLPRHLAYYLEIVLHERRRLLPPPGDRHLHVGRRVLEGPVGHAALPQMPH